LGLGAIGEAVDTAALGTGAEIIGIFKRWWDELRQFVWSQSVGYSDAGAVEAVSAAGPAGSGCRRFGRVAVFARPGYSTWSPV